MSRFIRTAAILSAFIFVPFAVAADGKAIDQAIDKGKTFLKGRYANGVGGPGSNAQYGIGPPALAGVAMLEARVPADDPAIKAVTLAVREAAYSESKTYQAALCLIYLDRHEDPADIPLIQVLALRLIAGQHGNGGWGYETCAGVGGDHVAFLKGIKAEAPPKDPKVPKRLHPDVAKYAASISKPTAMGPDDNSNTQFAILGLWLARKHGAPVEAALELIDARFRSTQDESNAGWGYSGPIGGGAKIAVQTTASMTCCGLLGLATGNARRVDNISKPAVPKKPADKGDPFFSAPAKKDAAEEKGPAIKDPRAIAALNALGRTFAGYVQNGGVLVHGTQHGDRDLYLLWSIERVGVIYNVDKLGGIDWYDVGSDVIVKTQQGDGSWKGSYAPEVDTSFALLFLCKADLLRDLSNKFRNSKLNELRSNTSGGSSGGGSGDTAPMPKTPAITLPMVNEDPATKLANQLVLTPATDWTKAVEKLRDAKGGDNTKGLVIAIQRLDGERKKEAREALADRLFRMSADTLKTMMKDEAAELRRGAVLAAAMKDDKTHVPDLIERLMDEDDAVVRAATAGLKSLTSQNFGPKTGASKDDCKAAAAAWKAWWDKNK